MHTLSLDQPQFWFLSAVIVGADIIIVLLLLLGVRRALLALGNTKVDNVRIVSTLGFVLFGWLALALFLAGQGVFRSALNQPVPYITLAIGIPILVGALFIRLKPVREIIASVPQNQLVAFQFYRVIGATFLVLHAVGQSDLLGEHDRAVRRHDHNVTARRNDVAFLIVYDAVGEQNAPVVVDFDIAHRGRRARIQIVVDPVRLQEHLSIPLAQDRGARKC